jgi:hypothetical protein
MNILFLNHKTKQCGVYQYGYRLYNILKKSNNIDCKYFEIENETEYNILTKEYSNATHIIYNYHCATMNWLNVININKNFINIGIPHESTSNIFTILLNIDPNDLENNNNIFNIPRPIYENVDELLLNYEASNKEINDFINYRDGNIPIFGSFGFGFQNKGFDKIVKLINSEYDSAIIKFIMPFAHYDPNAKYNFNLVYSKCLNNNIKSGIKLMVTTSFCSNEDILYFLKSNSMNIFLYDKMDGRGISSVIDYALSIDTPIGISDSYMFRHIYSDDICLYKTSINDCFQNSLSILTKYKQEYSNHNLISKFEKIINKTNISLHPSYKNNSQASQIYL